MNESDLVLSDFALTFRSGQRSKWHPDTFTEGFQRDRLLVFCLSRPAWSQLKLFLNS